MGHIAFAVDDWHEEWTDLFVEEAVPVDAAEPRMRFEVRNVLDALHG